MTAKCVDAPPKLAPSTVWPTFPPFATPPFAKSCTLFQIRLAYVFSICTSFQIRLGSVTSFFGMECIGVERIFTFLSKTTLAYELEVCGVWFFPLLLRSCVSKIDSCSWCDSWLNKIFDSGSCLTSVLQFMKTAICIQIFKTFC